jgi:hypothetical protein
MVGQAETGGQGKVELVACGGTQMATIRGELFVIY